MVKFANDLHLKTPSSNVESRQREVEHAKQRAVNNYLKVNISKYMEVVFYDKGSRKSRKIHSIDLASGTEYDGFVEIDA